MPRKQLITLVDFDADRLTALHAEIAPGSVTLRSWLTASAPESLALDKPDAVGTWIDQQLEAASIARGQLIFSMGRSDVVLKRLSFPTGAAGVAPDELAGMVRLQMARQLTMAIDSAAIDYVPIGDPQHPGADGNVSVIAAAMPGDRIEWCRNVAKNVGFKLARVSLRAFGAAALVREQSQRHERPVIAVALGFRTAEFAIVEDGHLVYARATDTGRPSSEAELDAYAERVAVELRRTWTSYRMTAPGEVTPMVAVLAEGNLARAVGDRCAAAVEGASEVIPWPSHVDALAGVGTADKAAITPLVGILHEIATDQPAIDFAHPRRAPDRRAATRQKSLLGVLGAIVLLGSGWAIATIQLGSLRSQLDKLQSQESTLRSDLDKFLIDHARLNHMETWSGSRVDWLAHLETINRQLPDPRQSLLDEVTGTYSAEISFAPKSGNYPLGSWVCTPNATLTIGGKVANRDVAADLRGRLISSNLYNVESRGADVADRYSLQLITQLTVPRVASETTPAAAPDNAAEHAEPSASPEPSDPNTIVKPAPPPQPAPAATTPATGAKPAAKPQNGKGSAKPQGNKPAPTKPGAAKPDPQNGKTGTSKPESGGKP